MAPTSPAKNRSQSPIPASAGVGLKPQHYNTILRDQPDIGFFEIHAENYMCAGGPPHRYLAAIRDRYELSLHGVGLSIGADRPLDSAHLRRLADLNARYQPALFSEHLAWSTHSDIFYNDLLPVPYNSETLNRVVAHVDQVQNALGRTMLLENPSTYVAFSNSTMSELDFVSEIVRRSGCGLLLDVNNVYVSAINHGFQPEAYLDAFPAAHVGEIHLAGHATDTDDAGQPLLIDAHDREVTEKVWELYQRSLGMTGPMPTLIEWDNDIPDWPVLAAEAARASDILARFEEKEVRHAAAG